jgi:hypothetical protein
MKHVSIGKPTICPGHVRNSIRLDSQGEEARESK